MGVGGRAWITSCVQQAPGCLPPGARGTFHLLDTLDMPNSLCSRPCAAGLRAASRRHLPRGTAPPARCGLPGWRYRGPPSCINSCPAACASPACGVGASLPGHGHNATSIPSPPFPAGTSAYPATLFTDASSQLLSEALASLADGPPAVPAPAPDAPPLLALRHLSVRTPAGGLAVDGLNLELRPGQHLLIAGEKWAGFATTNTSNRLRRAGCPRAPWHGAYRERSCAAPA